MPGAKTVGQRRERRVHLRVAVRGGAHDGRVEAERDVVHEDVAVHLGQVHRPLHGLAVGVERADDVVAVEAEVERQVVPGAGRHDHHRQPELGRHGRHHGLGAVAARHAEDVGAAVGDVAREPGASRRRAAGRRARCRAPLHSSTRRKLLGLPAAGLEVHDQHASGRGRHRRSRGPAALERADVEREGVPHEAEGQDERRDPDRQPARSTALPQVAEDDEPHEGGQRDHRGERPAGSGPSEREPDREPREREERDLDEDQPRLVPHEHDREDDDGEGERQRADRREPSQRSDLVRDPRHLPLVRP